MIKDTKITQDKEINPDDFFICDSSLLPLVEKAEEGCLASQQKLFESFADGKGTKVNLEIASYYIELAHTTVNQYDDGDNEYNKLIRQDILWNRLQIAGMKEDVEASKNAFFELLDYLRNEVPLEEWDFSRLEFIQQIIHPEE